MWIAFKTFLAGVFGGSFDLAASYLTKGVALKVAYFSVLAILWSALVAVYQTAIFSLQTMLNQNDAILFGLSLLPSNTDTCITMVITIYAGEFIFNQGRMVALARKRMIH
jgi:hypothetical protein